MLPGNDLDQCSAILGDLAADSLLIEARLTPKPGLVDAENSGAHQDMDLATFEASAAVLRPWFRRCVMAGWERADPADLVVIGLSAEQDMYQVTSGVNTHKGALYSLGLACAAMGELAAAGERLDVDRVCARVAQISTGLSPQPSGEPRTHGERALVELGLTGARGEAWAGFPRARSYAIPAIANYFEQGWSRDDALLATLVHLMAFTADTNLYARGGEAALRATWAWARGYVLAEKRGDIELRGEAFQTELRRLNADFARRNWSPGGSADLLALSWFLYSASLL